MPGRIGDAGADTTSQDVCGLCEDTPEACHRAPSDSTSDAAQVDVDTADSEASNDAVISGMVRELTVACLPEQLHLAQEAVRLALRKGRGSPAVDHLAEADRRLSACIASADAHAAAAAWEAIHAAKDAAPDADSVVQAAVEVRTVFILAISRWIDFRSREDFLSESQVAFGRELTLDDEAKLFHAFKATLGGLPGAFRSVNARAKRPAKAQTLTPPQLKISASQRVQMDALLHELKNPEANAEDCVDCATALVNVVVDLPDEEMGTSAEAELLKVIALRISSVMDRFKGDAYVQGPCVESLLTLFRKRSYVLGISAPAWPCEEVVSSSAGLPAKAQSILSTAVFAAAGRGSDCHWYLHENACRLLARIGPLKHARRLAGEAVSASEAVLSELFEACRWHLWQCDHNDPTRSECKEAFQARRVLLAVAKQRDGRAVAQQAQGIGLNWAQKEALITWGPTAYDRATKDIEQDRCLRICLVGLVGNVAQEILAPSRGSVDATQIHAIYKALTTLACNDLLPPESLQKIAKHTLEDSSPVSKHDVAARTYCLGSVMRDAAGPKFRWQASYLEKTIDRLLFFAMATSADDYSWPSFVEPVLSTLLEVFPDSTSFGTRSEEVSNFAWRVCQNLAEFPDETQVGLIGWQARRARESAWHLLWRHGAWHP